MSAKIIGFVQSVPELVKSTSKPVVKRQYVQRPLKVRLASVLAAAYRDKSLKSLEIK